MCRRHSNLLVQKITDALALLIARDTYGRPFLAPLDYLAPLSAVLQQGFAKMVDDPEF